MTRPDDVLGFWLDEVGPDGWYAGGEALDARCRARFAGAWEAMATGQARPWMAAPREALAACVLLDQLPRNMFRGTARAFASDRLALWIAKTALSRGWDARAEAPERQFLYMPLMHSEVLTDQDRCVRLFVARLPDAEQVLHARAHREQVRRFGRFPHRNAALGRTDTPAEAAFLAAGGYPALVRSMRPEGALAAAAAAG